MTVNIPKTEQAKRKQAHLAMFAKYWQAGKVKTRLARSIGEDAACNIHLLFVRILLQKFKNFGDLRTLVGSPAENRGEFEGVLPQSWRIEFQVEGNLGTRMSHFFESNECDAQLNILIGSDTPDLEQDYLNQVVDLLDTNELVLGPSKDGGYYLIAMQRHLPAIFQDVEWSSPTVLSRTIENAERLGISYALLPELNDVDEVDDLRQLISSLQERENDPFARQILDSLSQMELSIAR